MPLTADNVVQQNWGTVTAAGGGIFSVPLTGGNNPGGVGTTADNTVLVFLGTSAASVTGTGFTLDKGSIGGPLVAVLRKSSVTAGETSWSFTLGGGVNVNVTYHVIEMSNVDPVEPLDSSANSGGSPTSVATGGTLSTGTTPLNAALSTVVFAMHATSGTAATSSWSGHTNGFEELSDQYVNNAGGIAQATLASRYVDGTTGTFECTATVTHTSGGTVPANAMIVAYRAADSKIVSPLHLHAGFEQGTHAGINSHSGVTNMTGTILTGASGTFGTNYLIQAGSARASSYGLRIVCAASAAYVRLGNMASRVTTYGFNVRVVSSTGTVVVAEVLLGATTAAQVVYDTATTKFGVRVGTAGTISYESGTTAANTWRWIDLRFNSITTAAVVNWRIETGADTYAEQTAATGTAPGFGTPVWLGLGRQTTTQTGTFDYDDVVMSTYGSAYPLGPHQVRLLTVDPAGTPTVSGSTANFQVFTGNTTQAAWNATNARNAVDETPPTISASADGVCQITAAAADYMEFPMSTYTAAATETVVAVRLLAPMWSPTGTANFGFRGWDGTTETTLIAASTLYTAGQPTAGTATAPYWQTAMWQSPNGWTQAELDAAAVRCGFSTDATPDIGPQAIYLEVAVGKTKSTKAIGDIATIETNPNSDGIVSVASTAPVDTGVTLRWTDAGGTGSQVLAAGASHTRQFNAAAAGEVERFEVELAPELPDRE